MKKYRKANKISNALFVTNSISDTFLLEKKKDTKISNEKIEKEEEFETKE